MLSLLRERTVLFSPFAEGNRDAKNAGFDRGNAFRKQRSQNSSGRGQGVISLIQSRQGAMGTP